ncbi:S8 family peptidase [uncultured Clostridium sp.]|uniref:S8 family peptidase n=1 Tax=uncultured Clostridium sp. TaxID=59620 RepID=UPI00262752EC|nr:S8 family peptidase [uncultured Clostridium sp.]
MNQLLNLKGKFEQAASSNRPGAINLPKGVQVTITHLKKLKENLNELISFWEENQALNGALISVYYIDVIAKSRRIKGFLSKGKFTANSSIVGAKFVGTAKKKHIITHYISLDLLKENFKILSSIIIILKNEFNGTITYDDIEKLNKKEKKYNSSHLICKTKFLNIIVDSHYVEKFSLNEDINNITGDSIITIYKTNIDTIKLMEKLGIPLLSTRLINETTMLLTPDQLALLKETAPYLIAMATSDISQLTKDDFSFCSSKQIFIPKPNKEPIIGVIDTMFDKHVYFSEWVEFKNMLREEIELSSEDYIHGTAVTSVIVDGPNFNPNLDDGCGRFRVRHFGVATAKQFSSFTVLRAINEIILANRDIKVWNLSLGSTLEVNQNSISPEAAILDKIQYENDVMFIIAGTNKTKKDGEIKAIGAPADSINSLVVNSVNFKNEPTTYSREGPVLSFFTKPDISYYGGDDKIPIRVCTPMGESYVTGTSFAAPWITRKVAYLINVIGLSREVAKALIIDSASGWEKGEISSHLIGFGVVPIRIEKIIKSEKDEIKFVLAGTSEKFDTYNYNIPIPIYKDKHPFIAKATLCYFPCCERNQGVDYTNTELDIYFGRINGSKIQSINKNMQSIGTEHYLNETNARKLYRKWDNVKHIKEILKKGSRPKKVYASGIWGISIKTKERLDKKFGYGIKFGVVITLKELNGINRIDEFIKQCLFRGWLVNRVDIDNQIDIYNIAEEEIKFDE